MLAVGHMSTRHAQGNSAYFGVELFCCEPKHRLAEIVVNGEISIDLHPVNFVLPYDFLDQLITSMRDIRNPAAGLPKIPRPKTPENLLSRENGAGTDVHAGNESGGFDLGNPSVTVVNNRRMS